MEILSKEIIEEDGKYVVTETTRKTYTKEAVINEMHNIKMQKEYIIQQNKSLKKQFDEFTEKENEMESWLKENEEVVEEVGD